MQLLLTLLTFVLVVCCLFLGLLILIQLPKKEAGLGQAFGGAATEALFGAGSGNTLTKLTKYCAGVFIVLCVLLAWMSSYVARNRNEGVIRELNAAQKTTPAAVAPAVSALPTNALVPAPATNAAPAAAK